MPDPLSPRLEMLWEPGPPETALHQRFGLADAAAAGRWVADTLREHWGLEVHSCEQLVISDRNALAWATGPDGALLAKWSAAPERFGRLAAIARLIAWLDAHGAAVSAPLPCVNGEVQVELDGASMGLQRVITGEHLDATDAGQVTASGAALARLHRALATYPEAERLTALLPRPEPLSARIHQWLATAGEHLPPKALAALRDLTAAAPAEPNGLQLVHGDIRSANIVCRGSAVVAFLDFDDVRLDHPVDELARATALLGTRFHNWGPVTPEVRTAFLDGYQSIRPLTRDERQWWDVLVLWYFLAFVPAGEDPTGWQAAALSHLATLTPVLAGDRARTE